MSCIIVHHAVAVSRKAIWAADAITHADEDTDPAEVGCCGDFSRFLRFGTYALSIFISIIPSTDIHGDNHSI